METANALLSFVIITFMFAVIYKLLPDVTIAWRNVWTGAAVTAVLFTIGKSLIGLYLGRSTAASVYGAAGSLIVILLWISTRRRSSSSAPSSRRSIRGGSGRPWSPTGPR